MGSILLFGYGAIAHAKSKTQPVNIPSELKDTLTVQSITISGNQKTKKRIIYNELLFKRNGKVAKTDFFELVTKSRNNLLNTSLFNFVYIDYKFIENEKIHFHIKVDERWYTWLLPLLEHADRNFSSFLENGDWSRMNYGVYLKQENFRGMNETLKIKFRVGYLNEIEVLFNSAQRNNKLSWGTHLNYVALNQVSYNITGNEAIYIKTSNTFIEQNLGSEIFLRYRHRFVNRHKLMLKYNSFNIKDTLALLNPQYLLNGNTSLNYLSLQYKYNRDLRDSKTYPLKGHMFEGSITRDGLGLIENNINNISVKLFFQQYGRMANRLFYGTNLGVITNSNNNNPFVISNGLGYKEFLNGYEYNVIESNNYAYLKSKILFELVPTKTANINFINLNQFSKLHYAIYLKPFIDVGYVHKENPNPSNTLSNSYLYSYGIGIDLVTYYDKVLSFNYAINKFGYQGFYVHLNLAM
ncbi:POTRA domain-containing protein [Plebeiibacterium marinum]|uniref:POTRA domain-containing protein n=1 Tax=Plebeiibacterium marinum TaxID=2992111 RepID=A0AAE3MFR3_9BACT|nr:POTRA domain-containing protein [Plebeiobacterium marinum]MCW3807153.1 hypothetical protein [Plebeiobacterium marinum]